MRRTMVKLSLLGIIGVAVFSIGSAHATALVADWTFSNGSNLGADSSGNGYNLTAAGTGGGPTFDAAAMGGQGAAVFNGSDWFVDSSAFPSMLPTGDSSYTIMAWIQLGTSTQGSYGVVGWGSYSVGDQSNAFRTNNPSGMDNYWYSNDDLATQGAGTDNIYDGGWHLVAATFDGTTRTVYVDPQLGNGYSMSDNPGTNNSIGENFAVGQTDHTENFVGDISNLQIYNGALSESQILVAADLGTPEPGSLVLCLGGLSLLGVALRRQKLHSR
jgi:hypothetical protein